MDGRHGVLGACTPDTALPSGAFESSRARAIRDRVRKATIRFGSRRA
jgi:hypothetical protein